METRTGTTRRAWLLAAAIVFAAASVLYSAAWMYYMRQAPPQASVELGFENDYRRDPGCDLITSVVPGSPAESAGLKPNDCIVAVNGSSLSASREPETAVWLASRPGDTVELTVQRPGEPRPRVLHGTFRARVGSRPTSYLRLVSWLDQITSSFPVFFLVVFLPVLFMRLEDRNAWLLALLFSAFVGAPSVPDMVSIPALLRSYMYAYRAIFDALIGAMFYLFFAVFPARSPIDRRLPWLKWALLVPAVVIGIEGVRYGDPRVPAFIANLLGERGANSARLVYLYASVVLGLIALAATARSEPSPEVRRKIRVLLWGAVVGIAPALIVRSAQDFARWQPPFWLNLAYTLVLFLFPLSFVYAVVKHRVLDIPVLLKRSARYLVVERGFVVLLVAFAVTATILLANAFSARFAGGAKAAIPVGATFGVLLISAGTEVHRRVRKRLDHAFFRNAYDAQQILEELAVRTLAVTNRQDLAALLERHMRDALHPQSLAVYLQMPDRRMVAHAGAAAREIAPEIAHLASSDDSTQPIDLEPDTPGADSLGVPRAECLVPIRGSAAGDLQGLAVLGPRLSEEPYSSSDKRLLASVATQAGIAMRSIAMAEKMAERMEAERRAAQEMEIARQVQAKLLPQQAPALATLDCAGNCIQTRAVGGDYYDFLDLGAGRLGLVLADISGKGISAALLMANLQANLRSQYALALEDIPRLLRSVNHLFYKNTETQHYATAFFAVYDEETRTLRYVNCGHNAPMLLRASGEAERLEGTATVLGLFEQWDCEVGQRRLFPGDVLAIYTDGVTESVGAGDEEYGEGRLLRTLEANRSRSARELMDAVIADVQGFSIGEQADDLTLVVTRVF
ncbi:MAG: SpoIIE family protein phosphatase [Acidobacteriia bacterium]|nr:SpoIIE family protein phosphatase [Terriglobia bacterium]